ncbi:hypothetical protein RFI_27471 [Reticulomyxa filosa]|uniref:Uncharacterized protein n=1 Tax=Reticulomyxa filosa TaxID=46433 RepID=X6M7M6_RETFI|nr:hypothetical protein RFI_27471 [Reticulomyxa filosa]|eukprot:ETO09904.1 hypothetical protein RFI_27471 [Reticulomyxa filosa]
MRPSKSVTRVTSVLDVCKVWKPQIIFCDFDKTITKRDTVADVVNVAKKYWRDPASTEKKMNDHLKWYFGRYESLQKQVFAKLEKKFDEWSKSKQETETKEERLQEVIKVFSEYDDNERESVNRMNNTPELFANIPKRVLENITKENNDLNRRDHVLECLGQMMSDTSNELYILSMNWSPHTIYHCLDKRVSWDHIICNNLLLQDDLTTGILQSKVLNCKDKFDWTQKLLLKYQEKLLSKNGTKIRSLYIGDNEWDFVSGMNCDVSVWIKPHPQKETNTPWLQLFEKHQKVFHKWFLNDPVIVDKWK